jgi:hypothetical protein
MGKVIIGIHGLGNKPSKETLHNWWRSAMVEGLEKLGKSSELPQFELVYWADILYEKPLDEKTEDIDDPYFINEKYLPGLPDFISEENSTRKKVLDFIEEQLDKLFLNNDLTVNYSAITDMVIHRYFKDLEAYYSVDCLDENDIMCQARKLIRERLVETIKKYEGDEILLISHSMGSIVAYDVLTFMNPDIDIHSFVTIGSPLGFPVVQGKIAAEWQSKRLVPPKLKTPPGVKIHWYNFADLRDKIALIYDLSKNYLPNWRGVVVENFIVNNDYRTILEANHHKSFGYLRTPEFSKVLHRFIQEKSTIQKLTSRIRAIFQ